MATVILFDTAGRDGNQVHVHNAACRMVRTAKSPRVRKIEDTPDMRAGFDERGYPVRLCKCAKAVS